MPSLCGHGEYIASRIFLFSPLPMKHFLSIFYRGKHLRLWFLVLLLTGIRERALGQISISAGSTVTQAFAIGTTSTATLPTNWKVDKNNTVRSVGTYSAAATATDAAAAATMSSTAANGIYNFGSSSTATDRAVGGISSGSASKSVNVYAYLRNGSATGITALTLTYNVEKYRNGSNAAGFSMQLYYSTNGTAWTSAGADFLTSFPADANNNGFATAPGATSAVTSKTLTLPSTLAQNADVYLAWNYSVTSGTTSSNAQALGVDDVSITAVGAGGGSPTVSVSAPTLAVGTTVEGTPSSPAATFNVSGSNLGTTAITVTAPTANFQVSLASGSGFGSSVSISPTSGTVASTPIYVRLAGTTAGSFSGNVTNVSGAASANVAVSGTVTAAGVASVSVSSPTLAVGTTVQGTPSSPAATFNVSGTNLGTTAITVTAPNADFQVSLASGSGFGSSVSISPTSGTVASTPIYVRLAGTSAGSFSGNVTNVSGAASANVAVSGTVTAPGVATVNVSSPTLAVGTTVQGTPSSPAATYNVSGSNLGTTAIVVTAPNADFQVSLASGSGFGSSVSISPTSGTVASTPVYVRLAGTTAGSFSGNVTNVSGAASANVAVSGTVTGVAPSPTTLVNYDFNTGTSYAALVPVTATNVAVTATSTEAFQTFGGVASGAAAFVPNTTGGNAIAMNNSSGTNTRYFQFALGGSALSTYSSYKLYVQTQRSSSGANTVKLAYSTNGTSFTDFNTGNTVNTSFNEQSFDLSAITALNLQSSITFRLYASGASGSGTLRIDNFQVQAVGGGTAGASITMGAVTPAVVCAGSSLTVNYTATGTFNGGNTFSAELSDPTGSFASGTTALVPTASTATSLTVTIPATVTGSSLYQIRVNGSSPSTFGTPPAALTINNVSITPTATQNIAANTDGDLLTANEADLGNFGSRQWFSGTSAAGPFTTALTGIVTDPNQNEFTPNFATPGTYYVVVKTTFATGSCTATSNAVQINVGLAGISITTDSVSVTPLCVGPTGAPLIVPFTASGAVSGFTAYISNNGFTTKTAIGTGTTSPISATIPNVSGTTPTLAAGSNYRIRVEASTPATIGTDNGDDLTLIPFQTNDVTTLTATSANGQIVLSWANPVSCLDEVLVIGRAATTVTALPSGAATYTANAAFGSGTAVASGQFAVYQGTGTGVTVTGLTNGTSYTFKAFVKRNTSYSNGVAVTAIPAIPAAPITLTEVHLPQTLVGHVVGTTTHTSRVPYAFRVTLSGLTPSATYRYINQAILPADAVTTGNAVGNAIYPVAAGGFVRSGGPSLSSAGNYGTLVADATGNYTGWFILEPTGNVKFEAGKLLRMAIFLNNGSGGTAVANTAVTTNTVLALKLGSSIDDATAVTGSSFGTASNFVLGYPNVAGTGRPLFGTYIESDGAANTSANFYAPFYVAGAEAQAGAWATITANDNTLGIRRIEQRALVGGALVGCAATDTDGTWGSGLVTASPRGADAPLVFTRLDAPLTCTVYAGVNPGDRTQLEGNVTNTVTLRVTVPNPPAATLTVSLTDLATGTATAGTDYTFSTQNLTFLTTDTYPNTKTFTVSFLGDAVGETDETIRLSVTTSGTPATVVSTPVTITIADDDFIQPGLILNEFSNGVSGSKEYVELLVTGTPGKTVDLRGWVFDDNNGDFSNGNVYRTGITTGHIRFNSTCTWEKVLVGSLIVFYNAADRNAKFSGSATPGVGQVQDDPTDSNLDYVYVVPVQGAGTCGNTSGGAADYFFGSCNAPHSATGSSGAGAVVTYEDATVGPLWTNVSYKNEGDAIQIRRPAASGAQPAFFQGISYGAADVTTPSADNLSQANHPDFATLATDALYFAVTGNGRSFYFDNTASNDFRRKSNWVTTTDLATYETPGLPNSVRNATFINNLRQRAGIVNSAKSYTCDVRAQEARVFLDTPNDDIILRVDNNSTTSLGPTTASTVLRGTSGVRNMALPGDPFFLSKQYIITPTTTTNANYQVTFFVTDAELDAFATYVNGQVGGDRTSNFLRTRLKIWKVAGSTPVSDLTSASGVDTTASVVITADNYGPGVTTYTATFTSFSSFALGGSASIPGVLPVELTRFAATLTPTRTVLLSWATASEKDAAHFKVQRSSDGREFTTLGTVVAHGTTLTPQQYTFSDLAPLNGVGYYRLLQIDTDGQRNPSNVVSVRVGKGQASSVEVWPVPFDATLSLRISTAESGASELQMTDLQGRLVLSKTLTLESGATQITLPAEALPRGTYVLTVVLPNGELIRRKVTK